MDLPHRLIDNLVIEGLARYSQTVWPCRVTTVVSGFAARCKDIGGGVRFTQALHPTSTIACPDASASKASGKVLPNTVCSLSLVTLPQVTQSS